MPASEVSMTVLLMLAAAHAAPPTFGELTLGGETPASYQGMCAPIAENLFRCQAKVIKVAEVTGSVAVERCGTAVHSVKFVSLVVPGSGHDLPMATVSANVLEDTRKEFDLLRSHFLAQGFKLPDPGIMGAARSEITHAGATLMLEMAPVTDVPELPTGAWQAGFVLSQEAPCK
jgi:hypothetical protein